MKLRKGKQQKQAPAEQPNLQDGANALASGSASKPAKPKKRRRWADALLVLFFIAGLGVFLYPTISQYWNDQVSSRAVATFNRELDTISREDRERMWEDALEYNRKHTAKGSGAYKLSIEEMINYEAELNPMGTGMMGHIEIPKIGVDVPIYHGAEEGVLQIAAGHLEWSSLPVGGPSTHCVLSGHRGLPTSRLFTDLDQMDVGDVFFLHILDRTVTYEVDQIRIVLPHEVDLLHIEDGQDLCTLVTCTPYAINTHRLLVRGHRVDYLNDSFVQADAVIVDRVLVASAVAIPIFVILLIWVFFRTTRRRTEVLRVNGIVIGKRKTARAVERLLGIPEGTAEAEAAAARKAKRQAKRKPKQEKR